MTTKNKAIIYCIQNKKDRYIGSTMLSLPERMEFHIRFSKWYRSNMYVSVIREIPDCDSKIMRAYEQLYINKLTPNLNKNLAFSPYYKCHHNHSLMHCPLCSGIQCNICNKKINKYYYKKHKCMK